MTTSEREHGLRQLERAARRAERRLRLDSALRRTFTALPLLLLAAVAGLTFIKVVRPGAAFERGLTTTLVAGLAVALVWIGWAALRRRPRLLGAERLDAHHGLHDRVSNALVFADLPAAERTPMMELAIQDGLEHGKKLDPRRAVPFHVPRELWLVVGLIAALGGIAQLEVRTTRRLPPPPALAAPLLTEDDLELFRERLQELQQNAQDPEQMAAIQRYNGLLEDIAARRVDREEVFRRLAELERELNTDLDADREAMEEGLKALARELEKSSMTRKAAEALQEKRLEDAEKALKELADKLSRQKQKPSKAELEKLRSALDKASKGNSERLAAIDRQRQELQAEKEGLLKKKKPDAGAMDPKDQKALEQNQRKLEKLDRDKARAERSSKQMDELDKQLAEAAKKLMQEMGESAKHLEQSGESLNRMAQKDMTTEQKKELLRRLEELRDVMRQQGKGGKEQLERLRQFSQRARGQQRPGQGQGQGGGQNKGKGQGQGMQPGELRIGQGQGQGIEVDMPGSSPGQGQGQGQQGETQGATAGQGRGVGHDENLQGDPTNLKGETHDVSAAGVDTGQGTASAEVIYGAAQRGFQGKGYKDIFVQYDTVAEQEIEKDDIPPGYRFYVRRYFQLIRPRE
ncbi:MAG TPA: hypothetical protein VM686_39960 [Polyangiaceae bacterium]|nr:hypothetical protein [Polyangiaceae bacterium]